MKKKDILVLAFGVAAFPPIWAVLAGKIGVLSEDEYIDILKQCVRIIPDNVIVHRLTGDGDKKLLVAPLWSADKKHVRNRISREVSG